ncbi:hypothetical protein O2K51_13405 [Apibacter raozihei]|uniref:hypothetical protein n=1 Tax=Apibacter TaxID=1778601 RepID=UPI000FE3B1F6|nr:MULTISPECIES: hypothetical protein [Apibacter]
MYYVIKDDSETGKRLKELLEKRKEVYNQIKKLSEKYGFKRWIPDYNCSTEISAVWFDTNPNPKVWKKYRNGYYPKANTIDGRNIISEFKGISVVDFRDFNDYIGYDENECFYAGFGLTDGYVGLDTGELDVKMPKDCQEVSYSEYINVFKTKVYEKQ